MLLYSQVVEVCKDEFKLELNYFISFYIEGFIVGLSWFMIKNGDFMFDIFSFGFLDVFLFCCF